MIDQANLSLKALIVGLVGVIALAFGIASLPAVVATAILFGFALFFFALAVGILVRRRISQKYPPVLFDPADVSGVEAKLEAVRVRLAGGDSAAFGIHPTIDESGDAEGQIWLFASTDGVLGRVALELSLPDHLDEFSRHPAVLALLSDGWEVQSAAPGEWVAVDRSDLADATGVVVPVIVALTALFDIPTESGWSLRAIA